MRVCDAIFVSQLRVMNKKGNSSSKPKKAEGGRAKAGRGRAVPKGGKPEKPSKGAKPAKPSGGKPANRSRFAKQGESSAASASFARSRSLCPVSGVCGACQTIDTPYEQQLAAKQGFIEELFSGVAPREAIRPILGMEDPFHYRNKVISPYAPGKKLAGASAKGKGARSAGATSGKAAPRREILTGMYAKGTHKLVPTDACLLENQVAKKVTLAVRDIMARFDIEPYCEDTGKGFMRHAVVRVGHESGEVLVTLVTNEDAFPSSKAFCRELVKRVPQVTTVVQNVNTRQTNVILGERERTLYGPGFILDTLCGLSFRISSHSFYQVNATQTEVLYEAAIALAGFDGPATAIDAYCGTGTIGLVAAKHGATRVIGVDNVESAIADARLNARHNGVENAEFVTADAGAFMRELAASREGVSAAEDLVLLMDPPRAGSSEEFLDAAIAMAPSRIVYISCNPETQVRDVRYLARAGYRVEVLQAVDMFPHTEHVESIALITRGQK